MSLYIGRRAVVGGVVGALLGAGIGAGVGGAISSGSAPETLAVGGLGLTFGVVLGVLLTVFVSLPMNADTWEATFDETAEGQAAVAVHTDDVTIAVRATRALEGLEPRSLQAFDRRGRVIDTSTATASSAR
jgi:hypothetical protein